MLSQSKRLVKNRAFLFRISIFLILLIAFFLRINNFYTRTSFGQDNTRDMMIAQQALLLHVIPSIGPFSSAGPFVFGPAYTWTIMLSYLVLPHWPYAPFASIVLGGMLTVIILGYAGYLLGGKRLGLIVLLFTAISPQLSERSLVLSPHTWVGIASSCVLLSYIILWQKKHILFAFFLGLAVGFGISFHYQSLNLLLFIPFLFVIPKFSLQRKIISLCLMVLGIVLPLMPLLVWDSQQHFANTRNIMDYFLIGEYRIYVANSWKLFLFHYVPIFWSNIIGGYSIVGFICFILVFVCGIYTSYKRKISRLMFTILVLFGMLLFLNRYYRGERSEGYLLYFDPFIIIFTGWIFIELFSLLKRYIKNVYILYGISLSVLVLFVSLNILDIQPFGVQTKNEYQVAQDTISQLQRAIPNKKFVVYTYKTLNIGQAQSLSFALSQKGLTAPNGIPIGIADIYYNKKKVTFAHTHPIASYLGLNVFRIDKDGLLTQHKKDWFDVNPESVYDMLIGWSNKHQLSSSFDLRKYINSKI